MKLKQLSLFLENKPGRLSAPCKILAENDINILTMSLADTEQFGILRLIIEEWEKAKAALEAMGGVVNVTDVVAIEVENKPGGLYRVLSVIEELGLNVEYMYAFTFGQENQAVLMFRFEDPEIAIEQLQTRGLTPLEAVKLYARQ